jgi:cytoskeletal protein CcmA (bactofilin family)
MWKSDNEGGVVDLSTENNSQSNVADSKLSESLCIRGEVSGSEPLFVDCRVEGFITVRGGRVTVGNNARIAANINALEVTIFGQVRGNLAVDDRVQIHSAGSLLGDVTAQRLIIDDGAYLKGSVDLRKTSERERTAAAPALPTSASG